MRKLIARFFNKKDALENSLFIGGLLVVIWAGVRILTAPGVPCFGF